MDVSRIKKIDIPIIDNRTQKVSPDQGTAIDPMRNATMKKMTTNNVATNSFARMNNFENKAEFLKEEPIDEEQLKNSVEETNKALSSLNTSLQFSIHEGTDRMMVRVIDMKDHSVIKELPPREYLDMVARIRDMIGIFLDTRA
ncbi:flagellar protein FlaG [Heliorestis convoluta]|uniref:FlaG flagellar protein n=1 Tax=Heliorestis convoluta TaxID=356322 RepID=A0A5Q2MZN4_9FIRM|nr:flagellar protein FlaG [Heliorestis convoluta]QGG47501.1 flaG flagellar protein [Heliorestis convoluta]